MDPIERDEPRQSKPKRQVKPKPKAKPTPKPVPGPTRIAEDPDHLARRGEWFRKRSGDQG
jgi:hypothetical protein